MRRAILVGALALSGLEASCVSLGPARLRVDQVDYARALGEAKKREILALMVGLRFGDAPAFLNVSQIIAGYSFTANGGPTASVTSPGATVGQLTGTLAYGNSPTFTFTPTTGEAYATAYIRPLATTQVLPLAASGIPIDLLLRITVQSIGGLQNGNLLGGPGGDGSPEFFELLRVLRRLQLAGELAVRYKESNHVGYVALSLGASGNGPERAPGDLARARSLLGLSAAADYELVAGTAPVGAGKIAVDVRSVLAILTDLGAEVAVPPAEIAGGATKPTIRLVGGEERATVDRALGQEGAGRCLRGDRLRRLLYWIEREDFDSKYAFSVVQDVLALAEVTDTTKTPVVTIPAN